MHVLTETLSTVSNVTTPSPALIGALRPNLALQQARAAELALGRKKLTATFSTLPTRSLKPKELLTAPGCERAIFRLRTGWASQYCDLSSGRTAIVDVYVPGDVIGLDTLFTAQSEVVTLSSATLEMIPVQNALLDLMVDPPTALYMFWLLGQHQSRTKRRLAGNTRCEPRARVAMMVADFYARLRRRKLVTGPTYNLPMTQSQIADYVGLSAVHVNRVLRSLRDDGVVNLERNCATILNLERLTMLADWGEVVNPALTSTSGVVELSPPTRKAAEIPRPGPAAPDRLGVRIVSERR